MMTVLMCCVFQSLVFVSKLPYAHLFHSLLQIIAPEFFEKLEPCLETGDVKTYLELPTNPSFMILLCLLLIPAVVNEIDQWPLPIPGLTLNLPVMGVILQVRKGGWTGR